MFNIYKIEGYICQSVSAPSGSPSPSDILSKYFGRPVHLVMKGPRRRACDPTLSFPDLKANAVFQDGFPFLVVSEESLQKTRERINEYAHKGPSAVGGLDRRWEERQIEMERFAGPDYELNLRSLVKLLQVQTKHRYRGCWSTFRGGCDEGDRYFSRQRINFH
jgi:hypothetical protein